MFVKLVAVLSILIGILGLILPVIPGIFMIIIGILLLYRHRHEEISRVINCNAPHILANFYNNFMHRIILPAHYIGVDWDWVKKEIVKNERLDKINFKLGECLRKARSLTNPKYTCAEKLIKELNADFVETEGGIRFMTKKIPAFIKGASHLVLFVVTIGDGIEKEAGLLTSGKDPLMGYLLDRIGSFAVESLADRMEKRLRRDYASHKKSVSSRFSPGYCDWPIEEQFKMAEAIDFSKVGIRLTDGCMMVPKKSVSAIVAVAEEGVFKEFISSCDICDREVCDYRRTY